MKPGKRLLSTVLSTFTGGALGLSDDGLELNYLNMLRGAQGKDKDGNYLPEKKPALGGDTVGQLEQQGAISPETAGQFRQHAAGMQQPGPAGPVEPQPLPSMPGAGDMMAPYGAPEAQPIQPPPPPAAAIEAPPTLAQDDEMLAMLRASGGGMA